KHCGDLIQIEVWIIGERQHVLNVVGLEINIIKTAFQFTVPVQPCIDVHTSFTFRRKFQALHHKVSGQPGLGVEHVKGIILVLHSQINKLGQIVVEDSFVKIVRV